jgi:hypothetical protein
MVPRNARMPQCILSISFLQLRLCRPPGGRRSSPRQRSRGTAFWLAGGLAAVTLALGCGRRATHEDCELIVNRSVELQMRDSRESDARTIAEREAEVRAELDGEIKSCERDRRVTEKTMACVRSASTTQELDKCLR